MSLVTFWCYVDLKIQLILFNFVFFNLFFNKNQKKYIFDRSFFLEVSNQLWWPSMTNFDQHKQQRHHILFPGKTHSILESLPKVYTTIDKGLNLGYNNFSGDTIWMSFYNILWNCCTVCVFAGKLLTALLYFPDLSEISSFCEVYLIFVGLSD